MAGEMQSGRMRAGLADSGAVARLSGTSWPADRPLLDREPERHAIDNVLDLVRQGFSGALVLTGGHGVGKTMLLDYAIRTATGFEISVVVGAESEIHFAYGAVHKLLTPLLPLMHDLPAPQRQAVTVALGLESGPAPDPFLVGLACLTLVSRAAEDHPVLWAIDDAHLIDAESALVLGFIPRRLHADRVAMILTAIDGLEPPALEQLPTTEVRELPDDAAAELLRSVAAVPLDPQLVARVLADTGRNALALVEIGSSIPTDELAERAYRPEPMPVGRRLQLRYLQQASTLPEDAREFLLLVAAEGSGDRDLVRQAAAEADIDADSAEAAAEAASLIEVSGNSIHFRHPLIRTSVYNGASDGDRRQAHRLLGEVSGRGGDPDRPAWHRAAAAAEQDEGVAADLESAAERAGSRGAWATAAGLLRRSIELTPDDARSACREVRLAEAELVIGHPGTARQVAEAALPRLPDAGTRGRAQVLSGEALFAQGRDTEAADVLAGASKALASEPAAATDALLSAVNAAHWAGRGETERITRIAKPRPGPGGSTPRVSDLLLAGYCARVSIGYDAAAVPLRTGLCELRADDLDPDTCLRWSGLGANAAGCLWDDQALLDISKRWVRLTRRLGALTYLPIALAYHALADWLTGHLDQAADHWAEMRELIATRPQPGLLGIGGLSEGLLYIYRGDVAAARSTGLAQIRRCIAEGQGGLADIGRALVTIANLSAGDYGAAVDAALPVIDQDPPFTAEYTLPNLVEAAVRSGNREAAASAYATLASRTRAADTTWARGLRARCLALISDGQRAEEAYAEAISQLERSQAAVDLGRAHLLYGQWLRRAKRRREARRELRTAEAMYDAMGAAGFAAQAREELRATGERARSRTPDTEFDLTPQETRVAHLAAGGATNCEIAEQLFISSSTVEYHLAKVFRKLGVRSRSQLVHKLPGRD